MKNNIYMEKIKKKYSTDLFYIFTYDDEKKKYETIYSPDDKNFVVDIFFIPKRKYTFLYKKNIEDIEKESNSGKEGGKESDSENSDCEIDDYVLSSSPQSKDEYIFDDFSMKYDSDESTDTDPKFICNFNLQNILFIPVIFENCIVNIVCMCNIKNKNKIIKHYNNKNFNSIKDNFNVMSLKILNIHLNKELKKYHSENSVKSNDALLARISHEIRTPLNGIIGYNQLLLQTKPNKIQTNYIKSMNNCSLQLLQIINDALDYSKLIGGNMKLNYECFSIKDLIREVKEMVETYLKEKKQKLVIINCSDKYIKSDKSKIIQIILNLLINAIKFSPIGKTVKLKIDIPPEEKNIIKFCIIDEGIGITEENQKKLFYAFFQVKNDNVKIGTGLGLAISKKLANLLEGDITVKSVYGKGTEFIFHLKHEDYNLEKISEINKKIFKDKKILIVDDDQASRLSLSDYVYQMGAIPIVCATALEAMSTIYRHDFSLALIDICMPSITGTELAKHLKEELPYFPIIALSSLDYEADMSYFNYRIDKPIDKAKKAKLFNYMYKILLDQDIEQIKLNDNRNESSKNNTTNKSYRKVFDTENSVLIIDDTRSNVEVLKEMLKNIGLTNIDEAYDGLEGIEKLSDKKYDMIFIDLVMPKTDGYTVLRYIKEKGIKTIKVIVTASMLENHRELCKEYDADYFITKPIKMKVLASIINNNF